LENVALFSKIGWKAVESVKQYFGKEHQMMEADLEN
jgi:hypothetical protein